MLIDIASYDPGHTSRGNPDLILQQYENLKKNTN